MDHFIAPKARRSRLFLPVECLIKLDNVSHGHNNNRKVERNRPNEGKSDAKQLLKIGEMEDFDDTMLDPEQQKKIMEKISQSKIPVLDKNNGCGLEHQQLEDPP